MQLSPDEHRVAAEAIVHAERTGEWTTPVSARWGHADVDDAYRIALVARDLKVAAGRTVEGYKVGLTSAAMRTFLGATEPDHGFLFDDSFVPVGSVVPWARMNRPLVEQEVAFVLGSRLRGPSVHAADVIRATDFVLPALEVVDTRFDGRGPSMLVDSIADAASCGFVVLGEDPARLTDIDVSAVSGSLSVGGEVVATGAAAAVMGSPVNAVAWLANALAAIGVTLEPGDVVMSGSFIPAAPFVAGDVVRGVFDQLGEVSITVGA